MNDNNNFENLEDGLKKLGDATQNEPLPSDIDSHTEDALKRARFDGKNRFANMARRIAAGAAAAALLVVSIWGTFKLMNVDITPEEDEVIENQTAASMIASVRINGVYYEQDHSIDSANIEAGEAVATVEVGCDAYADVVTDTDEYEKNQVKIDAASVMSTILPEGTVICEWKGYPTGIRVCASVDGTMCGYTVMPATSAITAGTAVGDSFTFTGNLTGVTITDNTPDVIATVTDSETVNLIASLLDSAVAVDWRGNYAGYTCGDESDILRVLLEMADGSSFELVTSRGATDGTMFSWIEFGDELAGIFTAAVSAE